MRRRLLKVLRVYTAFTKMRLSSIATDYSILGLLPHESGMAYICFRIRFLCNKGHLDLYETSKETNKEIVMPYFFTIPKGA